MTAEDLQRVAKKYFDSDKSTIGYFIPKEEQPNKEKDQKLDSPRVEASESQVYNNTNKI